MLVNYFVGTKVVISVWSGLRIMFLLLNIIARGRLLKLSDLNGDITLFLFLYNYLCFQTNFRDSSPEHTMCLVYVCMCVCVADLGKARAQNDLGNIRSTYKRYVHPKFNYYQHFG